MLVPTPRLLWLTGLVAFPALTLAGIDPERSLLFFGIAAAAGLVALIDALRGFSSLDSLSASVPPVSRLVKGRPGSIRFRIVHSQPLAAPIRFAPALPHSTTTTNHPTTTHPPRHAATTITATTTTTTAAAASAAAATDADADDDDDAAAAAAAAGR